MKRFVFAAILFTAVQASAQKINAVKVPAVVKATFSKVYPKATAKWEMEDKNYEAAFKQDGKEMTVVIDAKGTLLETETEITTAELPKAATAYLASHYKGAKIKEAALIKLANGEINYEAEVKELDVIFDSKGNFLKTVKKEEKDEKYEKDKKGKKY